MPSNVMKMMARGGALIVNESCKDERERLTKDRVEVNRTFQFLLPYNWHYKYRHAIDDHNNMHHLLPLVEGTVITTQWELHVFSFLLAISKVNAFLTYHFFCKPDIIPTLQEFHHKLVWQLIKNRWIGSGRSATSMCDPPAVESSPSCNKVCSREVDLHSEALVPDL